MAVLPKFLFLLRVSLSTSCDRYRVLDSLDSPSPRKDPKDFPSAICASQGDGTLEELGRTESLVFQIYDIDSQFHNVPEKMLEEQQFLGEVNCFLSEMESGVFIPILKTEVRTNDLNPTWEPVVLSLQQIGSKESRVWVSARCSTLVLHNLLTVMESALQLSRGCSTKMPNKNLVSYNAMIGVYCLNCEMDLTSVLFNSMLVWTSITWMEMISGYLRIGDTSVIRHLFDKMPGEMRTVVAWTFLVDGYTANGKMDEARALFNMMPAWNCFVWSSMITGYFKKGDFGAAQAIFDQIPIRNLVNWNTLIGGYIQTGCLMLRCPDPSCCATVGEDMINLLSSMLVEFVMGSGNYDVICRCSYVFFVGIALRKLIDQWTVVLWQNEL